MMEWKEELQQHTKEAEKVVQGYLPEETGHQKLLIEASNYSVLVGGKRLRPMIMLESFKAFGGTGNVVEPFMAALEMIHSGSLVHDDLPCMDDDMMRRGKASTWAEYGEDMGVLAGDALMIYAFEVAAKAFNEVSEADDLKRVGRAIEILASKTGIYGMIGGQTVDVELAGGPIPKNKLDFIYRLKTGALLEASMMIGAVLAGASDEEIREVETMASEVGLAFQIQDDILDVTSTQEELGKPVLSDEKNQKTTYVTLEGHEKAKQDVKEISDRAAGRLAGLPGKNEFLYDIIEMLVNRKN